MFITAMFQIVPLNASSSLKRRQGENLKSRSIRHVLLWTAYRILQEVLVLFRTSLPQLEGYEKNISIVSLQSRSLWCKCNGGMTIL